MVPPVLGPLLFVLYTAELVDIAAEIGINIQYTCMRMVLSCTSNASSLILSHDA